MKPFLMWAGGKAWLAPHLVNAIASVYGDRPIRYWEPFLGAGAVLLELLDRGLNITHATGSDINRDLIYTWGRLRTGPEGLRDHLEAQLPEIDHEGRKGQYYKVRELFNYRRQSGGTSAAFFLFLNRWCYRGLYRENKKGDFNVPFGRYKEDGRGPFQDNLEAVSALLQSAPVSFDRGDFIRDLWSFGPLRHDGSDIPILYCDPPYDGTFTSYHASGFSDDHQAQLYRTLRDRADRGVSVIVSGPRTHQQKRLATQARLFRVPVDGRNAIGPKSRKPRSEVVSFSDPELAEAFRERWFGGKGGE